MRKVFIGVLALLAVPAMAAYTVDLGTDTGEAGVTLNGWGPQTTPADGTYGYPDAGSYDGAFRLVWVPGGDENWAEITFSKAINAVNIRYLDGLADDSFDINVYNGDSFWGSVSAPASGGSQTWVETGWVSGAPGTTLRLTATGQAWSGFQTSRLRERWFWARWASASSAGCVVAGPRNTEATRLLSWRVSVRMSRGGRWAFSAFLFNRCQAR